MSQNNTNRSVTWLTIWDGSIEVSEAEMTALKDVRQQLIESVNNQNAQLFTIITGIVELILEGIQLAGNAQSNIIGRTFQKLVRRKQEEYAEYRRTRRATVEVLLRLLTPDLDYCMQISDVELACREVWGAEAFPNKIPSAIYDKVRFSLESGVFWEYCESNGLGPYLRSKHRQVEISYLLYKNGSSLRRLLKPS